MSDYIPQSDDGQLAWLITYRAGLATNAATLGIAPADLAIQLAAIDKLIAAIQDSNAKKAALAQANQIKKDTRSDVIGDLRTLNNRIKTEPNYTAAIGAVLGIIGSGSTFDFLTAKPTLTVLLSGGIPVISFSKEKSNGVKIYSKRASETVFSFLALDTHSPYHDTRANLVAGVAELREYYAFYIDNSDDQFGLQSDTISIMVS